MLTAKESKDHKNTDLYKLRHSLAHILAEAVLEIKPQAKLGFGPPVDNGFYYEFDFGDEPIVETDLKNIEKVMKKIIKQKHEFTREDLTPEEAYKRLEDKGEGFKAEYARDLVEAQGNDSLSFYTSGKFDDMCEGPHLDHTGLVPKGSFKLDRIAGSYWRGDEKNKMLTRIYGLAFNDNEELKNYIELREKARNSDHRKLGQQLEIFMLDEEVGPGLPLWLPNGTAIMDEMEKWAKEEEFKAGYVRVSTPSITKSALYHRSGHLPYYEDSMFPPMKLDDEQEYYLRPMTCPHHHKIFGFRQRSYRELPLRIAEYGDMFRYEKHGSLSGLLRVRQMCLNDSHIYCEPDQVDQEFTSVIDLYKKYYDHLRLGNFRVRLSTHDPASDKFVDNEEEWNRSEKIVREVLNNAGIEYEEELGEAAFYGPKVDIQVANILGREETVSTCQLDFCMAERFDLSYIGRDGNPTRPYILHRAPLSTHERFVSFLIELYGGALPTWMAPVQVALIPISQEVEEYANSIYQTLRDKFVRVEMLDSADTFNYRLRNAITSKYPNVWIIGEKEQEAQQVSWRRYCTKAQETVTLEQAVARLDKLRAEREMDNFEDIKLF